MCSLEVDLGGTDSVCMYLVAAVWLRYHPDIIFLCIGAISYLSPPVELDSAAKKVREYTYIYK